jgi:hypothetical protein
MTAEVAGDTNPTAPPGVNGVWTRGEYGLCGIQSRRGVRAESGNPANGELSPVLMRRGRADVSILAIALEVDGPAVVTSLTDELLDFSDT